MDFQTLPTSRAKELLELCRSGKLYEIEGWIAAGESLSVPPDVKKTPLQIAVRNGFHSLVLLLARNEPNQKVKNNALAEATKLKNLELVQLLLAHGAEINGVQFADVLLTWEPRLIRLFLDRGADVVSGFPFSEAFANKVRTSLRPFIEFKKSHPEMEGQLQEQIDRALRYFCHAGDLKWVSLLSWAGADPRTKGPRLYERDDSDTCETALEAAVFGGSVDVLRRLKPNPQIDDLADLLAWASIGCDREIVRYLLSLGANPNCKPNGGSAAIDRCLSYFQLHASLERRAAFDSFSFNSYRAFDVAELLMKSGAIWRPDGRREMDYMRKALYECEPDVTVKWLKLFVPHGAASGETIRELLRPPRMREHLAGKRWWMCHLGFKDLFPTESQVLKRHMAQNRIVPRHLLAKYDREELYKKVWDRPVQIVAKDFGMSDVGLAKICRKLFVPLPGRGYWAKKAAYKKVPAKPALPPVQRQ